MKRVPLILLALTLLLPGVAAQSVLKIAAPTGTEGYSPLLVAIYEEMGYKAEIAFLPAERALQSTNAGDYDAEMGLAAGTLAAYPNLMYTTEAIISASVQAWTKKGSTVAISVPADLKKYKVGLVRGNKLPEALVASLGVTAESAPDGDSLGKMLMADRFDVALVSSLVVPTSFPNTFVLTAPNLLTNHVFHILNKKNGSLVPKFDAVLKAMKADGRYQKLLSGK